MPTVNNPIPRILRLLHLSERLKVELRHSWLSNGRQESVAEHCWQMALMALVMHRYLEHPVDLEETLKMILIHDLVEALAGMFPFSTRGRAKPPRRPVSRLPSKRSVVSWVIAPAMKFMPAGTPSRRRRRRKRGLLGRSTTWRYRSSTTLQTSAPGRRSNTASSTPRWISPVRMMPSCARSARPSSTRPM